uniref:PHD-type domain-containing protein n=1 Tax=Heliothis virescens TaxID=7102 RepID=A0A2A4JZX8_HELVI
MSSKKTKCSNVKNPCKFCLQQVNHKTGLQCQGACKKWAHFKCLNYTPGKISDIKAGIIKVTCPCPDCDTEQTKEFLVNPPYTCSNHTCPANNSPTCDSVECPSNIKPKKGPEDHSACKSNKACAEDSVEPPRNSAQRASAPARKNKPPPPAQGKSFFFLRQKRGAGARAKPSSSDPDCSKNQAAMVAALQEMCGTVGQLSIQLKELMCKIVDTQSKST